MRVLQTTEDDDRGRQTLATVTSLAPYTMRRWVSNKLLNHSTVVIEVKSYSSVMTHDR